MVQLPAACNENWLLSSLVTDKTVTLQVYIPARSVFPLSTICSWLVVPILKM